MTDWPKYRSHKIVEATPILRIDADGTIWINPTGSEEPFAPTLAAMALNATAGSFAVRYDNQFKSISPEKVFLDGYVPLGDEVDSRRAFAVARVCHEVNRAICEAAGDMSQKPWEQAEQWQRNSATSGVEFAFRHPDASPEAQHENWMKDKIADGWTWGSKKDPDAKTHPCIVPYHLLPFEQRVKDHAFRAVVKALV